jgi:hypothetical protein
MEIQRDPVKELDAMRVVATALADLDAEAVARVLRWAAEAFGAKSPLTPAVGPLALRVEDSQVDGPVAFANIADLYAAAQPRNDADKALVVGYWIQILQGAQDFESQGVNTELKHLGHGIGNITQAFSSLMHRKPQLVIQTRKAGVSQQARKRFKLTTAGQQAVERMIKSGASNADSSEM